VAGCRGGEVAVWQIAGDRVASKPAVHRLGLPTSVCAVAASPVNAAEVSAWRQQKAHPLSTAQVNQQLLVQPLPFPMRCCNMSHLGSLAFALQCPGWRWLLR
jgi:hypothetical protein